MAPYSGTQMESTNCAQINLDNLIHNIRAVQTKVRLSKIIPVVKADAYGHGAVAVTRRLVKEGYDFFAVAQFSEAMELRESGIKAPILIFGRIFPDEISQAVKANFRLTLSDTEDLRWIKQCHLDHPAIVHVNIDTGMGRLGFLPDSAPDFFNTLRRSRCCRWEGLYSHFACADEKDKTYADLQLSRFQKLLSKVQKVENGPSIIHMANSAAVLDLPKSYFTAVRPGIFLYGHYPSQQTSQSIKPRQVMTLKTVVTHVRHLPKGHPVSYGRRWITPAATRIAVLPIGYADGLRRDLTNKGEVLIRGRRYPMVGAITMDHTMVDVGMDPVSEGDEAVLWGDSDHGSLSLTEIATKIGAIPYELTCGVSRRVRRVYIEKTN